MRNRVYTKAGLCTLLLVLFLTLATTATYAQFEVPRFEKVTKSKVEWFDQKFADISWTGQGLNQKTAIDSDSTKKLRATLQTEFGNPTLKLENLLKKENFRLGHAIQFEYRFVVNDSIPLMVLDVFGPFGRGLSYVGASRYIDLMPQIKRTLSGKLTEAEPAEYGDYYYSADREKWYYIRYENGEYSVKNIESPEGMSVEQ